MHGHSNAKGSVEAGKICEQNKKNFQSEAVRERARQEGVERKMLFHLCARASGGMVRR